jgi:hypothetical protein
MRVRDEKKLSNALNRQDDSFHTNGSRDQHAAKTWFLRRRKAWEEGARPLEDAIKRLGAAWPKSGSLNPSARLNSDVKGSAAGCGGRVLLVAR